MALALPSILNTRRSFVTLRIQQPSLLHDVLSPHRISTVSPDSRGRAVGQWAPLFCEQLVVRMSSQPKMEAKDNKQVKQEVEHSEFLC